MYSVYVRNNMPSLGFTAQHGEKCVLDFTFVSQYRDDISEPYKPTGELGLCTVMIKNSKFTDFTVVKRMEISSNVSVKQDVSEWLTSGSNNIKVSVEGENTDKTTAPVTYIVQLTSLGISAPNFAWWMAFAGDISIPMIINGNISKTLHVTVLEIITIRVIARILVQPYIWILLISIRFCILEPPVCIMSASTFRIPTIRSRQNWYL